MRCARQHIACAHIKHMHRMTTVSCMVVVTSIHYIACALHQLAQCKFIIDTRAQIYHACHMWYICLYVQVIIETGLGVPASHRHLLPRVGDRDMRSICADLNVGIAHLVACGDDEEFRHLLSKFVHIMRGR